MKASRLYIAGFVLLVAGSLILVIGGLKSSSESVSGIVFIGPIPIVFGSGPGSGALLLASLTIAVLMVVVAYVSFFRGRNMDDARPSNT